MTPAIVEPPKEAVALTWLSRVESLQITTAEQAQQGGEYLHAIADLRKAAEDHHRPVISAAHETHKRALEALKRVDEPLKVADAKLRPKLAAYADRMRREAEEERRRIEEEERRRQEAEAEAAIVEAESQGASPQEIAALVAQAETMPVIIAPAPKVAPRVAAGVSSGEKWTCKVVDIKALCRAIAEGRVSEVLVVPNEAALNGMARAMKSSFNVPGCQVAREVTVARR